MKKALIMCLVCIILFNLLGLTSFAAWVKKDEKTYYTSSNGKYVTGWQEIGGKSYYFNQDGSMVTKSKTIDGIRYRFNPDGVCGGKYGGWVKDSKYRYYYQGGIKQTGWLEQNGNKYYLNRDGIMRTGWVAVNPYRTYYFDKNGVWDGKDIYYTPAYKPETIGDFLLDFDFPVSAKYDARIGNNSKFKEFAGIKTALSILKEHSDVRLSRDKNIPDDEIEMNNAIYRGKDDILVRLLDEKGKAISPGLQFSKDKAGNSYFYCSYYNFGIKLNDKDAYDKIAKLIKD